MIAMPRDRDDVAAPGWLLDEVANAGRENLDEAHAFRYDVKEDAGAPHEVRLCQTLGLGPESTLVDLGAGTGQFALAVAAVCGRVVAVDVSPVMLDRLRAKVSDSGVGNIEMVQAGFLTYEHAGGPADFVYSRYALHHLPDFWKAVALGRLHQMLRPGGVLRLCDVVYHFEPGEAVDRLASWCSSAGSGGDDGWSRVELEEHVRDEHSTFTWILEPMMERAGFRVEEASYSTDGIVATYVVRRA
jgi:ubiquinone/menaquinone biosynthesis C-methylase UbiE